MVDMRITWWGGSPIMIPVPSADVTVNANSKSLKNFTNKHPPKLAIARAASWLVMRGTQIQFHKDSIKYRNVLTV